MHSEQSEFTQKPRSGLSDGRLRDFLGKSKAYKTDAKTESWCEEGDSNPYTLAGVRT